MTSYSVLLLSYFFSEFDIVSFNFFQFVFHLISPVLSTNLEFILMRQFRRSSSVEVLMEEDTERIFFRECVSKL
jgi:hypothetical protein